MGKTFIIGEAGVNHNGKLNLAKKLIDVAVNSGVNAVKFQVGKADDVTTKFAKKAPYQNLNFKYGETQYEMIKKLELTYNDYKKLYNYSNKNNIMFLSTPFDLKSIEFLYNLGLNIFKIPSGEITNLPYLRKIGSLGKEVIMSTGMSNMDEINKAVNVLLQSGLKKNRITVLHCVTAYPTPFKSVNLRSMLSIKKELGVKVGYSDHTVGIEVSIAAVAMGANVIEKHFTLDRNMDGPDHKSSLEPHELKYLVKSIRNVEKSFGKNIKVPSSVEIENMSIARKSLVSTKKIKIGDKFSEKNLSAKRPGTGISPMSWDKIIGKRSTNNYEIDDLIDENV